ncbi:sulfotransferase domain-containing protein [Sulfurimonas sp. NW7]|uniref:sulfotransferase domain-containing protein n=1 Tax=Sulfurimonas sp. NW7 TaxID=2922727 RepID=UPI003DA7E159
MHYNENPVVLISGFKAGTWLMRKILTSLTNMEYFEPEIIPGEKKYYNAKQLQFVDNHFYSWHLVPTPEVVKILNEKNAKTIFVMRNIYDVVVSIYYHFYNDIDADIGRGNAKDSFLKQFSFEEGISLIITGFDEGDGLRWNGMAEIIEHFNRMSLASLECESLIFDFENIVKNKKSVLAEISNFLDIEASSEKVNNIQNTTAFGSMKKEALSQGIGVSHFREGKANSNRKKLSYFHKVQIRNVVQKTAPDFYKNLQKVSLECVYQET